MKPIRWSRHALNNLKDREIDLIEADKTLASPDRIVQGRPPRKMHIRRYMDKTLNREMALCVLVEETDAEAIVVTLFKTSQVKKFLEGTQQ